MSILLHKPYLVKWSTRGVSKMMSQILSTWLMDDPEVILLICFLKNRDFLALLIVKTVAWSFYYVVKSY